MSAHEWVSYEDAEGSTYLFDVTFLVSNWTCIYGRGCPGVLTEAAGELEQGCCSYGAHFTDKADRKRVERFAQQMDDDEWQFRSVAAEEGGPIKKDGEGAWVSRLVDDACIFLNRPDFHSGAGCALHSSAERHGERPLDWKPEVCWQVPLRLTEEEDENGYFTYTLREWKRRDWGAGGFEFDWWCTDSDEAFIGATPAYKALKDEIIELVGEEPYAFLATYLKTREKQNPSVHYLPHPAVRTKSKSAGKKRS